ncbi:Vi polysaccharide biosynthesis UDP-N-acetylglucosamine C-6 dehydrogenase TviB [Sphingomicrobium sp. XHP0239]|uniref:Vi polysaccharide biosynthesis UDP-N-acetylglucosamine C-6 dehydrogenase TviB n=1 Tax=Sphingomicrobium maritimum TaxID=3133972 RepID=UPI0031CCA71B
MMQIEEVKPAVIGLGYVGLPLAVELGKQRETLGFDINPDRIAALSEGRDATLEVEPDELAEADRLRFSHDAGDLAEANFYIVTVPTPIDANRSPDLGPLLAASRTIGPHLRAGDVVVYESTVYPGCTEEDCVPVLEEKSGLKVNRDFFVGYSPERINPGDKEHRLPSIMKVTAGSTPEAAELIDKFYRSIITAGTHKAPSIRVAEAAKVIENTQRDLNIALVNELAILFDKMDIDTLAVLEAAGTKWNFLPFRPGLVGGHCIGVDPYYLTHKAEAIGHHPEIILAGRRLNDAMGAYAANRLVKEMLKRRMHVQGARILVLGLAFKENCPDVRNTRVVDVVRELEQFGAEVEIHDPWVEAADAERLYDVTMTEKPETGDYDAVILAVPHQIFLDQGADSLRAYAREDAPFFDLKARFAADQSTLRL